MGLETETQGGRPVKMEAVWRDLATSQGRLAATRGWKRPAADSPSQLPEGTDPADAFISDSGLQNCERTHFCCFNASPVCGTCHGSHRTLTHFLWPPLQLGCGRMALLCPGFASVTSTRMWAAVPTGLLGRVPGAAGSTTHLGLRCTACHPHGVSSAWDLEHSPCCRDTEPLSRALLVTLRAPPNPSGKAPCLFNAATTSVCGCSCEARLPGTCFLTYILRPPRGEPPARRGER